MRDIGRQHDPAAAGVDAHELHARRILSRYDPDHVFDLERMGEKRMAHVAADRVVQFHLLPVELRVGKPVKIADVVVDCESAAAVRAYYSHL